MQNLMAILYEQKLPELVNIKMSVAIYLRNYIRGYIPILASQSNQGLTPDQVQSLVEVFFNAIMSPVMEMGVKRHLFLVFEYLVNIYQSQQADKPKLEAFYTNVLNTASTAIQQGDRNQETTKGALLVFQAVLFSLRDSRFLTRIFPLIQQVLCRLVDEQIAMIGQILMELAAIVSQPNGQAQLFTADHPIIQRATVLLEVVNEWMILHVNTMEKWDSKKNFGYQLMTQSGGYANSLAKILSISFPINGQAQIHSSATLISVTGIAKLDSIINKVKHRAHEYLNYVYRYLFEKVHASVKAQSPFLAKGIQFCPYLINSIMHFSTRPDFDEVTDNDTFSELIIEAIDTLVLFTGEKEFAQIIGANAKNLLVHIGFNYMRTTAKEMEELRSDPEGFVNLSLDLCDKQKSHIIKTQGAKLLEAICDNIDGAVYFVTLFACQTIHHALNPGMGSFINSVDQLAANFYQDEYVVFTQTSLFLKSPPEIQAETSIVALTTLSYVLPRRADLLPVFQEVLANNIDRILGIGQAQGSTSVLLKVRMSLLLGYYADMLFTQHPEPFLKVIDFLFMSLSLSGVEKVVALQSADTLSTVITDKDLIPRLELHIPRIVAIVNDCIMKINIKLFFNFLLDFVKTYNDCLGDSIITIIQTLVQRVLIELKSCHEKGEKNNLIINKCWNVIRMVSEFDSFMPRYAMMLEEALKPLFEFIIDPARIEFEDDIVLTLKSFIKKTNEVSQVMWTIFPHLEKVFAKNKGVFGNLLDTLNQYLVTGRQEISRRPEFIQMIINMAATSVLSKEPTIAVNNSEGCILYQLLFQIYAGTQALDPFFLEIMAKVRQRMTLLPRPKILVRHLLSVFLAALAYNPNITLEFMEREVLTHEFFKQITSPLVYPSFINQYERKTLVIGLAQALSAERLPAAMSEHMLGIFKVIIETMNKLKDQEAKALRKAGKKEISLNSRHDDEARNQSDEEDEEDYEDDSRSDGDDEDNEHEGGPTHAGASGNPGQKNEDEEIESAGSGVEDEQEE